MKLGAVSLSMNRSHAQACFHCGQDVPEQAPVFRPIEQIDRAFCCHGCAGACEAIYEAGLQSFYQRTQAGDLLAPPPPLPKDVELYDFDEVQSEFTDTQSDQRILHLMVEGIHCAACVWLIESSLARLDGVLAASVNLTTQRLKLRWDNSKIRLSTIITKLGRLGYQVTPFDPDNAEARLKKQNRNLLYRVAFAGFAMMNVMWIAVALYTGAAEDEYRQFFHWVAFAIATPTLIYAGYPFLKGAWDGLRSRRLGMDVPISIGLLTTYFYSLSVTLLPEMKGEVYFDTLVDLVFLLLIGRYLEAISRTKAVDATQRLMDMQPKVAFRVDPSTQHEEIVPVRLLKAGDWVRIKPGDKIPVDGQVLEGRSHANEAMLTGESREIAKQPGDLVSAGSINLHGALLVQVQAILHETALGRIIHLVEEAQNSRAPIQCTADKILPYFVSATLTLAALSLSFWWWNADFETALLAATAVLIITCPCAFGLATPMAIAVASGVAARQGIFVKNGAVLEKLSEVDHVVFDKTGTLTRGEMQVVEFGFNRIEPQAFFEAIGSIESLSEHSIARAVCQTAQTRGSEVHPSRVEDFTPCIGKGVNARYDGTAWAIGSRGWMAELGVFIAPAAEEAVAQQEAQMRSCVWVARERELVGWFSLEDPLRDDAHSLIDQLREQGIGMTLLTGDRLSVAQVVAQRLGGNMAVIAEVLPHEKDLAIQALKAQGKTVLMVGDGVNDAPALLRADIGVALGSGTDVSLDSADIVLTHNRLMDVSAARRLSARTLRTVKQNIGLSLTYNLIMVPLAMAALLTPMWAAITMPLSSLLVIGNAARLRRFRK